MGTGLEVVYLVVAAAGAAAAYSASEQAADAQERAGQINAKNQRNAAENERRAAEEQIRRKRIANRQKLGTMRARMAKSGAATTTGSPLIALGESASRLELEAQDVFGRAQQAHAARINAANMSLWQGNQQAAATRTAGTANAISSGAGIMGQSIQWGHLGNFNDNPNAS